MAPEGFSRDSTGGATEAMSTYGRFADPRGDGGGSAETVGDIGFANNTRARRDSHTHVPYHTRHILGQRKPGANSQLLSKTAKASSPDAALSNRENSITDQPNRGAQITVRVCDKASIAK